MSLATIQLLCLKNSILQCQKMCALSFPTWYISDLLCVCEQLGHSMGQYVVAEPEARQPAWLAASWGLAFC